MAYRPNKVADFADLPDPPLERTSLDLFRWFGQLVLIEHERTYHKQRGKKLGEEVLATARVATTLRNAVMAAEAAKMFNFGSVDADANPPLDDEVRAAAWMLKRLARYIGDVVKGRRKVDEAYGAKLRRTARTWATVMPPELGLQVAKTLRGERKSRDEGAPVVAAPPRDALCVID